METLLSGSEMPVPKCPRSLNNPTHNASCWGGRGRTRRLLGMDLTFYSRSLVTNEWSWSSNEFYKVACFQTCRRDRKRSSPKELRAESVLSAIVTVQTDGAESCQFEHILNFKFNKSQFIFLNWSVESYWIIWEKSWKYRTIHGANRWRWKSINHHLK